MLGHILILLILVYHFQIIDKPQLTVLLIVDRLIGLTIKLFFKLFLLQIIKRIIIKDTIKLNKEFNYYIPVEFSDSSKKI